MKETCERKARIDWGKFNRWHAVPVTTAKILITNLAPPNPEITIVPLTTVYPSRPHVASRILTHTRIRISLSLFLFACTHENLFRNCIKGTFAPGSLSGRFGSGRFRTDSYKSMLLRKLPRLFHVSSASVVTVVTVVTIEFYVEFRSWIATLVSLVRLSKLAFARLWFVVRYNFA